MTINLDQTNGERAQNFFKLYALENIIGDSESKYYLGNVSPQICRFCLKDNSEVTFNMDAHVIPQFMGNKNLISYFECDECNRLFSKYEDSFANFFGITRTFAQIKGQTRKVPKFKDPKTGLEVFVGEENVQVIFLEGNEVVKIDDEAKSFEITTEKPGYIPIHIPKLMIKMGLSMLKESDLPDYDYARRFIHQNEKDESFKDDNLLRIFGYFIPGPPTYDKPFVQLYKKKDGVEEKCFNRHIVLFYANYCFQMVLPYAESDKHLQGGNVSFPFFPLLVDNSCFEKFGQYQKLNLNLTSHNKKSGEEHKISFSFESSTRTL